MSYAYRLNWTRAVKVVEGHAHLSMKIDMLQLLPEAEMLSLLQKQLALMGWQEKNGLQAHSLGELDLSFDPTTREVALSLNQKKKLSAQGRDNASAQQKLASAEKDATKTLNKNVSQKLMKHEAKVREQIQEALRATYLQALKIKAARMGEVQSVQEHLLSDGTQELVIKVKA